MKNNSSSEKNKGTSKNEWFWKNKSSVIAGSILTIIVFACVFCRFFMTKDPTYMIWKNCNISPNKEFFFGTDTMGRDIFSMILYGGRISLFIGLISTVLSTTIAVIYGSFSGIAPEWIDELMMRFTEILLSIPSILLIIFRHWQERTLLLQSP